MSRGSGCRILEPSINRRHTTTSSKELAMSQPAPLPPSEAPVSGWAAGWAAFAGIMLVIVGFFHAFVGLVAIIDNTFYVVGRQWAFEFDITAWGWVHLIGGAIVVASGFGIFTGNVAARTVGVVAATVSALVNFAWLPYYPVWSVLMIAIAITVIWALTVHGRDLASAA
jgi:hypothetical protein